MIPVWIGTAVINVKATHIERKKSTGVSGVGVFHYNSALVGGSLDALSWPRRKILHSR